MPIGKVNKLRNTLFNKLQMELAFYIYEHSPQLSRIELNGVETELNKCCHNLQHYEKGCA